MNELRLVVLLLVFGLSPAGAQSLTTVVCHFPESWNGRSAMLVMWTGESRPLIDTTTIALRQAVFSVNRVEAVPVYVWAEDIRSDIHFFLDAPQIEITLNEADPDRSLVQGSIDTENWRRIRDQQRVLTEQRAELRLRYEQAQTQKDTLAAEGYRARVDSLGRASRQVEQRFLEQHPRSALSWYYFNTIYSRLPHAQATKLLNRFDAFAERASYWQIQDFLHDRRPNRPAPPFTVSTTDGRQISLAKLRRKYVLLDLCSIYLGNSRQDHVSLKKIYARYQPKGFEILSLFLDENLNEQHWREVSALESLPWWITNSRVSRLESVRAAYGLQNWMGDPRTVLIGPDGLIIGWDLPISQLEALLSERL